MAQGNGLSKVCTFGIQGLLHDQRFVFIKGKVILVGLDACLSLSSEAMGQHGAESPQL